MLSYLTSGEAPLPEIATTDGSNMDTMACVAAATPAIADRLRPAPRNYLHSQTYPDRVQWHASYVDEYAIRKTLP